jgi:DNA mismatch repair protein MutH
VTEFRPPAPSTVDELFARADRLAGHPLAHVAARFGIPVPEDLRRAKGWIGQLLETALGATAKSRAEPDFPHLGVELKTLPVTPEGAPRESTYVCTAPLDASTGARWEDSWVCRKLSCVLWVPVVGAGSVPVGERVIGSPLLWRPSPEEDAALRADWEELTEIIALGELWQLTAHRGKVLQIRPKAADRSAMTWTVDEEGEWARDNPRGFYLRPRFTRALLARHFRF